MAADEKSSDGWTMESLRVFLLEKVNDLDVRYNQRFVDQEKATTTALTAAMTATTTALAAADRAVTKAEVAAEKRFESVNEFRNTLSDQASRLMPRTEVEQRFQSFNEKIDLLQTYKSERTGATQQGQASNENTKWLIALVIGSFFAAAALVANILLKH